MSLPFKKWAGQAGKQLPPSNIDDYLNPAEPYKNPFDITDEMKKRMYENHARDAQIKFEYEKRAILDAQKKARSENVKVMARQIYANLYSQPAMMIHTAEERFNIAQREAEAYFNLEK